MFNALTGLRQKVANYPGVTVEKKIGALKSGNGAQLKIYDLPGLYSLVPKSLDDKIASDIIAGRHFEKSFYRLQQFQIFCHVTREFPFYYLRQVERQEY